MSGHTTDPDRERASEVSRDEWERLAAEPATDEEIEMHKRNACRCVACLDKLRLIARIDAERARVGDPSTGYLMPSF